MLLQKVFIHFISKRFTSLAFFCNNQLILRVFSFLLAEKLWNVEHLWVWSVSKFVKNHWTADSTCVRKSVTPAPVNPVIKSSTKVGNQLTHWPLGDVKVIFKSMIFTHIIQNSNSCTCYEIAPRWMPQDLTEDLSALVQVMSWCRQATSHYLNQCWPSLIQSTPVISRLLGAKIRERELSGSPVILRESTDSRIQDHRPTLPGVYNTQTVCWAIIEVLTFPGSLHTSTSHQQQITTSNIRF